VVGVNNFLEVNFEDNNILPGRYTLITFGGNTNVTASRFTVRGFSGKPYNIIVEKNEIILEVLTTRVAGNVAWSGVTNSLWDYQTVNFKNNQGDYSFVPGDSVFFEDGPTNKDIIIQDEQVTPVYTEFSHNHGMYTLSGSGGIGGDGSLKKLNNGTLQITTVNNTYTGSTHLEDGITEVVNLQNVGVESSLGAGSSVQLTNTTLRLTGSSATDRAIQLGGDSVVLNTVGSGSIYVHNSISGAGTQLIKEGMGTLNLNTGNTFKSVILKEGRISLATLDANRSGLGNNTTLTFLGDSAINIPMVIMKDNNSDANTGTPFSHPIVIPEGKIGRINFPMRWKVSSNLTGAGTLQLAIPYIRCDFRGNWSNFTGTVQVLTTSNGGQFRINNDFGYGKTTFDLQEGTQLYHITDGKIIKVGAINGTGRLSGSNTTWQLGGNALSSEFAGTIAGTGSKIEKEGTGVLKLSGSNPYTGSTTVKSGTLIAAAPNSVGTSTLTVNSGATLSTVNGKCEELNINGLLDLKTGSRLIMEVEPSTGKSDYLNVSKKAGLNTTLELVKIGSGEFSNGNIFTLFEVGEGIVGNLILPELPEGLKWDTSMLYSSGTLVIVPQVSSVDEVSVADKVIKKIEWFDMLGHRVNEQFQGPKLMKIIYEDGTQSIMKKLIL
jgi:autotransporter-associated beta strand protein